MLGCCHWIGWRADWWYQIVLCKLAQTIPGEALPSPELKSAIKHKKVTLAYYVLSGLFIYSSFYTLHNLSILPRWCFPILTHLNWVGTLFWNPSPFCRIKGILITKRMPLIWKQRQMETPGNGHFSWFYKSYLSLLLQTLRVLPTSPCVLVLYALHQAIWPVNTTLFILTHDLFPLEKEAVVCVCV